MSRLLFRQARSRRWRYPRLQVWRLQDDRATLASETTLRLPRRLPLRALRRLAENRP